MTQLATAAALVVDLGTLALGAGLGIAAFLLVLLVPVWIMSSNDFMVMWSFIGFVPACVAGFAVFVLSHRRLQRSSRARWLALGVLLPIALVATGAVPITRTLSWDEEVLLADGRTLVVRRDVTRQLEDLGDLDSWAIRGQSIAFTMNAQRIVWSSDDAWPREAPSTPSMLHVVDGRPVVVLPVFGSAACTRYDHPPQGLVAFTYDQGRWQRPPVAGLPQALARNLWWVISESEEPRRRNQAVLTLSDKAALERRRSCGTCERQGESLAELSRRSVKSGRACTARQQTPSMPGR